MKKSFLPLIVLLLYCLNVQSQDSSTIKVTGKASVSVQPTETVISFKIESVSNSYVHAIEDMAERVDQLTRVLRNSEFEEDEIFTSNFGINKNVVFERGSRRDSGFVAIQHLYVRFAHDKKRLLEVLNRTTNSKAKAEIDIRFELDEVRKSQLKNELIRLALQDARQKAELLAEEAMYDIGGIREIIYGSVRPVPDELMSYSTAEDIVLDMEISNFQAANLSFTEQVFVIFRIEAR